MYHTVFKNTIVFLSFSKLSIFATNQTTLTKKIKLYLIKLNFIKLFYTQNDLLISFLFCIKGKKRAITPHSAKSAPKTADNLIQSN